MLSISSWFCFPHVLCGFDVKFISKSLCFDGVFSVERNQKLNYLFGGKKMSSKHTLEVPCIISSQIILFSLLLNIYVNEVQEDCICRNEIHVCCSFHLNLLPACSVRFCCKFCFQKLTMFSGVALGCMNIFFSPKSEEKKNEQQTYIM